MKSKQNRHPKRNKLGRKTSLYPHKGRAAAALLTLGCFTMSVGATAESWTQFLSFSPSQTSQTAKTVSNAGIASKFGFGYSANVIDAVSSQPISNFAAATPIGDYQTGVRATELAAVGAIAPAPTFPSFCKVTV